MISVFDIFKIGIGPSSSHTMGPWRAAQRFLASCRELGLLDQVEGVRVDLYGSLAKTGRGHGTDVAVMLGLLDWDPVTCDPADIPAAIEEIWRTRTLLLGGQRPATFDPAASCLFHSRTTLTGHPNALAFTALLGDRTTHTETYYSVGGGFIVRQGDPAEEQTQVEVQFRIDTSADLLRHCHDTGHTIPDIVRSNELLWRDSAAISDGLRAIWDAMIACVFQGCHTAGTLPGGLAVSRRAAAIDSKLLGGRAFADPDRWLAAIRSQRWGFTETLDWVSCFALAVNEENAAFGRVVTAPTNGAAGVIPAVLLHYLCFAGGNERGIETFLLTAGIFGAIIKKGATISAAMGGCQAEIGVSSAMAAAGLTQCLGGSAEQVAMAAEIALEHHLGLTCDPVGGLVQIPCIERNTMGAVKAITAANLALVSEPGNAKVTLDAAIRSMWETALDMNAKYKETAEGGLALQIAVNVVEC